MHSECIGFLQEEEEENMKCFSISSAALSVSLTYGKEVVVQNNIELGRHFSRLYKVLQKAQLFSLVFYSLCGEWYCCVSEQYPLY